MCFFFSCTPWHKPSPYFKGACNQFGFGVILKSKDQLSISDHRDGSSTSVFSSTIFKKMTNTAIFRVFNPFFSKTWRNGKFRVQGGKKIWQHLEPSYLHNKSPNLLGCDIFTYIHTYIIGHYNPSVRIMA